MPTFDVRVRVTHTEYFTVEADSEEDAADIATSGDVDALDREFYDNEVVRIDRVVTAPTPEEYTGES